MCTTGDVDGNESNWICGVTSVRPTILLCFCVSTSIGLCWGLNSVFILLTDNNAIRLIACLFWKAPCFLWIYAVSLYACHCFPIIPKTDGPVKLFFSSCIGSLLHFTCLYIGQFSRVVTLAWGRVNSAFLLHVHHVRCQQHMKYVR